MPCYHPLQAYENVHGGSVVWNSNSRSAGCPIKLPCGQCVGCRLERSRQWAVRCMHEAQMFDHNCFITLTYAPEHLPMVFHQPTLVLDHFQKFMKRLRFSANGLTPIVNPYPPSIQEFPVDGSCTYVHWPIRFFHAGEYGEKLGRPHYHACLFNYDFSDKVFLKKSPSGMNLYRSSFLEELWPFGHSSIGSVTFQSAAYVARYIMKKQNGKAAPRHYASINPETGEILSRSPEYTTMSRRPGIGSLWFDKFHSDVFPHDYVIVNGRKCRPPKYYDTKLKAVSPDTFEEILYERFVNSQKYLDNNTPARLAVREEVQLAQLSRLPRKLK